MTINKLYIATLLLVLLSINSFSQESQKLENTVFWEVTGNNISKPSYIYGTIHILPKKDFVTYKNVDAKLSEADLLVLEMIVDVPISEQIKWAQLMMLADGKSIDDFINDEESKRLKSLFLDTLNIKEKKYNKFKKFKPITLYSLALSESLGKTESYELYFSKLAKQKNIETYGLETFEEQLAIFDSVSVPEQIKMFFGEGFSNEMSMLTDLYSNQNIDSMAGLVESDDEYAKLEAELLTYRNLNWVNQLKPKFYNKSLFIAVGAAHLGGKNGLIRLLRKEGFTLTPIMLN